MLLLAAMTMMVEMVPLVLLTMVILGRPMSGVSR